MALQTLRNPMHLAIVALLALALGACSSTSESGREGGGEGSAEHSGGEGREGGEGGAGDGEETAVQLNPTQTFWMTRKGVRLDLRYDAATRTFRGSADQYHRRHHPPSAGRGTSFERAWSSGRRRQRTSRPARPSTSRCRRPARHSPNGARMPRATALRSGRRLPPRSAPGRWSRASISASSIRTTA